MHKQIIRVLVTFSLLLSPLQVVSTGTVFVEDSVAGLGTQVTLSGWGPGSASLELEGPSGHRNSLTVSLSTSQKYVTIPGNLLEEAGVYSLALHQNELRISQNVSFEILPDHLDPETSGIDTDRSSVTLGDSTLAVVFLRDRFGNPLVGRPIELISSRATDIVSAKTRETDESGEQAFTVSARTPGEMSLRALDLLSQTLLPTHAKVMVGGGMGGHTASTTTTRSSIYNAQLLPDTFAQEFDVLDHFEIEVDPPELKVGEVASILIRAADRDGNTVENYVGTVRITAPGDPNASLPGFGEGYGEVTFTERNLGQKLLPLVLKFEESGEQRLVAEDRTDPFNVIEGETVVMVEGRSSIPPTRRIEITSHAQDSTVNGTEILLEGVGPPFINLLVIGGVEDAIGETNALGKFSIPIELADNQRDFTLRVRDDTGNYDSGSLHLILDQDVPEITSITFSPPAPEEESNVLVIVESEPELKEVALKLQNETIILDEERKKPGTYQSLFPAPEAGSYQPTIVVTDIAGNVEEVRSNFVVTPKGLPTVQNVKATPRANAIDLSWELLDDADVTAYRIYVAEGDDKENFLYTLDTDRPIGSATVAGLKPGTLYHFVLTAIGEADRESAEKSRLVSSRPLGVQLKITPQPEALQIEFAFDSQTVDQLSSYFLEYGSEPERLTEKRIISSKTNLFTLRDLLGGITYYVRITPVAISGDMLRDLAAEGTGMPVDSNAFHASPSDQVPFPVDNTSKPSDNLHNAPNTPISGVPLFAWWIAGTAIIVTCLFQWQRRQQRKKMRHFLRMVNQQYQR